jgi:hypothetical protein
VLGGAQRRRIQAPEAKAKNIAEHTRSAQPTLNQHTISTRAAIEGREASNALIIHPFIMGARADERSASLQSDDYFIILPATRWREFLSLELLWW